MVPNFPNLLPPAPTLPCGPVAPTFPLQIYFVKLAFTSPISNIPLLLASKPYSNFVPPEAQLVPVGSAVVFTKVFFPLVPLVPFVPFVPFVPLVPGNPCGPCAPVSPCGPTNDVPLPQPDTVLGPNKVLLLVLM